MDMGPSVAFGTLVRRYRVAAGWTQEELAERAGISRRNLSDLERGVGHIPRKDTVALLATALDLGPRERAAFAAAGRRAGGGPQAASGTVPAGSAVPTFVGRERELALLERHLVGKGPPVLLLAGEPGIGKTRLLHAALPRAVAEGMEVLQGGCQRRGGQEPYAPLLGALQQQLRRCNSGQLRAALQGCAWLVHLLPELAEGPIPPLPPWTLPPEQERRLMSEAVVRLLTNLAGPAGTLLLLDDLQWASPDALDLLATIARSAAEVPVRIVGAYRDTEIQPQDPLSVMLADLAHAGLAARHLVGPLAPVEAAHLLDELLEGAPGETTAPREQVLARAGGVPFFVVSCARALQVEREDHQGEVVPWDVGQSVRQRAVALPEATREVLGVAAVLGRVVLPALLTAVADRAEPDVVAALDAACRARLLVETGEGAYQFAHDVIREVLEADVGVARRMRLHRRVAEALEQRPGEPPVELLAYHYNQSGERHRAALYLERAGDRALAQYANAAAESYYRQVVGNLDALGRGLEAARVREKLSDVLFTLALNDAALAILEPALETYHAAGDVEGQARVLAQIGWMHAARATRDEGLARLQPFLATLGSAAPSRGQAALYATLAWLLLGLGRYAESVVAAEQGAQVARAVGDDRILANVEHRRGYALFGMGRAAEGLQVLESALPLAEAVGDLSTVHLALGAIGRIQMHAGAFERSKHYFLRALDIAERIGHRSALQVTITDLGGLLFLQGDWSAARGYLERAADLSRAVGWSNLSGKPYLYLAQLHLAEGEWAQAARDLDDCQTLAGGRADLRLWPAAQRLLAECELMEGRPDAALARLIAVLDLSTVQERELTYLMPLLARVHLERGEHVQAADLVATGIRHAQAYDNRLELVEALRVQAMVHTRQEQWAEAEHSLEAGLALARSMPYPYAEARLLQVYGEMHAQKGEPGPARQRLEAALALFQRLGARKDAAGVEQALGTLQNAPSPDAAGHALPFPPPSQRDPADAPAGPRLARTDRQAWALAHLRTASSLSPRAYAAALGVSVDTALRDLQELVARGCVQAVGTTKDRRYTLVGEAVESAIHRTDS